MSDSAIHDPVDPIHTDFGDDIRPIAVVVAGGKCGAVPSAVRVPEVRTKAAYPTGGSPALVRHVEAVVGTLHRELLDHVIILNERHLKRLMSSYLDDYHPWRTHRSLDRDAPNGRPVRAAETCNVVEFPAVHGFHHVYLPQAA
jgi:hypothetical protein